MHDIEVTVEVFKTEIDIIDFTSAFMHRMINVFFIRAETVTHLQLGGI